MAQSVRGTTSAVYEDNEFQLTGSAGGWLTVAGESVFAQLRVGAYGGEHWQDDALLTPGTYTLIGSRAEPVAGIRLKDAVTGTHATFSGMLYLLGEPQIIGGAEFTGSLSSSGAYTPGGGGAMTAGAVFYHAGPVAPAGSVACDGATYDGTQATFMALWNAIGLTWGGSGQAAFKVPDLRRRYPYGADAGAGYPVGTDGGAGPPQFNLAEVDAYTGGSNPAVQLPATIAIPYAALLPCISLG